MQITAADLSKLKLPADYVSTRPHIFPSDSSLKWFIRRHREKLVAAQAISRPLGRDLINEEKFDSVVLEVGQLTMAEAA